MNKNLPARRTMPATNIVACMAYAFLLLPTLIVIPMSFGTSTELEFPPSEWGFDLYMEMLDPQSGWLAASARSLIVGVLSACSATILGVTAAYGLSRAEFQAKKALGFLILSPIFAPTIVLALALFIYFSYLRVSGSMLALVLGHTLVVTPFVVVTAMAGLRHIDRNIEVAAAIMGASRVQVFLLVVVPMIRPAILSGTLLAFLLSFDEVVVSWFIGASSEPTLPVKMYSSIQWEISPVLSAVSATLVLITFIIFAVSAKIMPYDDKS